MSTLLGLSGELVGQVPSNGVSGAEGATASTCANSLMRLESRWMIEGVAPVGAIRRCLLQAWILIGFVPSSWVESRADGT